MREKRFLVFDNASPVQIQVRTSISSRLRDFVTARVTRVMRSPAMFRHVHTHIVTGHPKRKVYLVQKMVRSANAKKTLGRENCISIWHPPD